MPSLHAHLQARMGSAYRRLQESLAGLSAPEAAVDGREDWRRYHFGVGLNGSIEGIVRHVATWKLAAAEGLRSGSFPDAASVLSPGLPWEALLTALADGHQRLTDALAHLAEEDLAASVNWEGQPMPIHTLVAHMIEHDQYHTGQINLLRQQHGHRLE